MYRGLYSAALSMNSQWHNLKVIANNLANISSTGYKKDEVVFSSLPSLYISRLYDEVVKTPAGYKDRTPYVGELGMGVGVDDVVTIHSQGALKKTDNPLDIAIDGDGFFCVKTDAGERYTRSGNFGLDAEGFLVTQGGYKLLSEINRPIQIEGEFSVTEDGMVVLNEDGVWKEPVEIARLKIVSLSEPKKIGANLFSGEPKPAKDFIIRQGYLEASNVNPIFEMVKMIEVQRLYEASQRVVLTYDEIMNRGINDVGRIA